MSTLIEIPVKQIAPHPDNIRRDATPDTELVNSVKEQGILQPLGVIAAGKKYQLIAGHRRLNAAKKAGLDQVPVIVLEHLDTRAKQIEAMLVENGRRQDLSAVEEAAAYEQLTLEGLSTAAIAKATGRTAKTVKARLALTALPEKAAEALHGHQMTLAVAEHLIALKDYPHLLKEAEELLANDRLREFDARRLAERVDDIKEHAALRAKYAAAGLPAVEDMPKEGWYASKNWQRLYNAEPADADAYYPGDDRGAWHSEPVLLKALKPVDETPEAAAERKAREKAERAKFKAQQEALELRHQMRLEHIVELGRNHAFSDKLLLHLRVATGKLINSYGPALIERITKAAGVDELVIREKNDYQGEALAAAVNQLTDAQVVCLLLACLAQTADSGYSATWHRGDDRANANEAAFWQAYILSGYDLPKEDRKEADKAIAKVAGA